MMKKRWLAAVLAACLALAALPGVCQASGTVAAPATAAGTAVPASFTAGSNGTLQYWLYTPADAVQGMPLVVYLHGGSGKGDDLALVTEAASLPQYLQSGQIGDVRAYVLMPQCPAALAGWEQAGSDLQALIAAIAAEYKIDTGNISLTGHSMGGSGVWSLAAAYPALFARIAPLSGGVRWPQQTAAKLKDIPVWAFVGAKDTIVPPESSEQTVALIQRLGGNAHLTVLPGADHFAVPQLAYLQNSALLAWLTGAGEAGG